MRSLAVTDHKSCQFLQYSEGLGHACLRVKANMCIVFLQVSPPLSRSVHFHLAPNYFNPLISRVASDKSVYRHELWGKISASGKIRTHQAPLVPHHWALLPPGLCSSGLLRAPVGVTPPKIRCQGIFPLLSAFLPACQTPYLDSMENYKKVSFIY